MKRLVAGGFLLLFVVIGLFLWRQNQKTLSARQIAPADCLVFIELPDLARTVKRWPDTALFQILAEPSVQRFMTRPISRIPKNYQSAWASMQALRCSAIFFGMTDPNRQRWLCGFQTSADQKVWRKEIGNISANIFGQSVQEVEAEHYDQTGPRAGEVGKSGAPVFCAQVGSWILLSQSTDLLVDATRNAKVTSAGLQSVKLFQDCRSNVKTDYDILCFVHGKASIDFSNGLRWSFHEDESPDNPHAMLAVTVIDGTRLRDTIFTLTGTPVPASPLDRKGLAMTTPATIGYLVSRVNLSEIWRWCDQLSAEWSIAKTIRDYIGDMKAFGIDVREFDALLSHVEMIVNRDPKADLLNAAFSIWITDPEKFQRLCDQIAVQRFPDGLEKIKVESVPAYLVQLSGNISIVYGFVGHQLLVAWSRSDFAELLHRLQSQNAGLENNAQFKATSNLVHEPEDLFVYVDAKAGFESLYDASRTMLVFGVALIPTLNKYIDALTFPETGEVSKHLSPIVLSRHRVARGVVDESVGPITAYEALALMTGGTVAMGLLGH